jgi:hypothetical protein
MPKPVTVDSPEIRFRPEPEVYARALQVAKSLGVSVTDIARIGLAQFANSREIRIIEAERLPTIRDLPIHGVPVDRIADIASKAARAADQTHVRAGRLEAPSQQDLKR